MKEKEIRRLVRIVEESDIAELEVSRWGRKVRIRKYGGPASSDDSPSDGLATQIPAAKAEAVPPPGPEGGTIQIVSPMVGTFYRAPAPNAEPFVDVNDIVKPSQTVCIVEAMKLMNEIESEVTGRIVKILVENGQPVEYNQPLFLLEPV
ncbi:MAG: acetyl-CoA carboxylase biotin carboxyl carrier protein [bacterium]